MDFVQAAILASGRSVLSMMVFLKVALIIGVLLMKLVVIIFKRPYATIPSNIMQALVTVGLIFSSMIAVLKDFKMLDADSGMSSNHSCCIFISNFVCNAAQTSGIFVYAHRLRCNY